MSTPICPVKECGHRLIETTGPWRDRGDWMCHGEHDGKRIWYSLELIQILESKLASAEDECSLAHSQRRDEAHRANNAERRLSQTEVKLAFAEARVKELEGLASKVVRAWKAFDLAEGDWERTDSEMELANSIGTLGDAMSRKDS